LVHGSGGITGNVDRWSEVLNRIGVATFVTDSFTARGIESTMADQAQLGRFDMILDAYRALAVLAAHRRIDATRVALMGFSRGGHIALYASLNRFARMHGPQGVSFAAYLPFCAPYSATYIGDEDVSDAPIRLFHGSADDYTPVAPCRAYVERLRKAGKDVTLTEYPDAHHGFDNPLLRERPQLAPAAQTMRGCTIVEEPQGVLVNAVPKSASPCVTPASSAGPISATTPPRPRPPPSPSPSFCGRPSSWNEISLAEEDPTFGYECCDVSSAG
jgi:dienelactone hydrolase